MVCVRVLGCLRLFLGFNPYGFRFLFSGFRVFKGFLGFRVF